MMEYVSGQKKKMELIFKETFENKENLVDLFYGDEYPKNEDEKNVNVSIYGESIIKDSHKILIQKLVNFNDDLYTIQKHKFRFQISSLVLFIIISIIGVAGYWLRREYIPWVASLLLLLLAAPVFGMAGLETTYTFLSIDFCSSIGNSVISDIVPSENKGIGTYLSCPSKETMRTISTAIYQYIVSFDNLYKQTEEYIKDRPWINIETLGEDKRNNSYFEELFEKTLNPDFPNTFTEEERKQEQKIVNIVQRNLKSFGIINVIMAGLLSMTSCFTAKNSINFIEEKYCHKNHAYMFRNVVFDMVSALGFIIISIGLNKLIITMKSHFARALRGKKEFNTDIIDEDDD